MRDAGNMHVFHAGLYEFSYRLFYATYQKTSIPTASTVEETIQLHKKDGRLAMESSKSSTNHISAVIRCHAAKIDGVISVK